MNILNEIVNANFKQSESQNQKILSFLQNGGRLTQLDALKMFNCFRLSARIKDLRDEGHQISSKFISVSYSRKRVAQYFMEGN